MPATHNADIQVNVYGETQAIDAQGFGRIVHATDDVEAGFTDKYRIYESNNDAQSDADLSANAKAAAAAFFSQEQRPPDLAIAKVTYESVGDELKDDLTALLAEWSDWYGLCCQSRLLADQQAMSEWAAANDRLASVQSSDAAITAGTAGNLFEVLNAATNNRAFGAWHDDDAEYVDLDWLTRILAANPDEQSSVAHDKILTGPTAPPDSAMDSTKKATVEGYNGNIYLPFYGPSVMRPGLCFGGKTVEDAILEDWFQARLQEKVAALAVRKSNANDKVGFDDFGIGEVEGEIRSVYNLGEGVGHFVEDTLVVASPKYADLTTTQIASKSIVVPVTCRKKVGLKDFTINVGVTF